MEETGRKIRTAFKNLSEYAIGWEDVLTQTMFALATREHAFWFSGPGQAKSWTARAVFSMFSGAKFFKTQITKDMLPNALFGNEIPDEYMRTGREIFNLEGGIADAHFVFLDEFLDAPDYLARAINTIVNERRFERKDMQVDVPLHSAIMTTNFNRFGLAMEAVRDRMMCKALIPRVERLTDRLSMHNTYIEHHGQIPSLPQVPFEELAAFVDAVESPTHVVIPAEVRLLHAFVVSEYDRRRFAAEKAHLQALRPDIEVTDKEVNVGFVTQRTEVKLHDFSRAAALFDGRSTVEVGDLWNLRYGLVMIGADNADEATWQSVGADYIPSSRTVVKDLQKLAAIAIKVAELKKLSNSPAEIVIRVAGKVETFTKVSLIQAVDRLKTSGNGPVKPIATQLLAEINELGTPPSTYRFSLAT